MRYLEGSACAGKARNLQIISKHGFRIPMSFYFEGTTISENPPTPFFKGGNEQLPDWIVRSSFGVEDHSAHSFAGCFASEVVLNASADALTKAMLRVADSINTEHAQAQILASGNDPRSCTRGILVQQFITGTVSGVAFSCEAGSDLSMGKAYTEWALGGCSSITSGEATPQRASFTQTAPTELRMLWKELTRGVAKLERLFDAPVDVEWTYDGKHLWWLQVRPIAGEAALLWRKSKGAKWSRAKIAERFPDVMTPMGWSLIEETLEHSMKRLVTYTDLNCKNIERASLLYRGLAYGNENYFRHKNCGLSLAALGKTIAQALFFALRPANIRYSRGRFFAYLAHRSYLNDRSKHVLAVWHHERDSQLRAIKAFSPHCDATFDSCLQKISELRALSFDYFKTDLAIYFLKEANVHFVTRAITNAKLSVACFADNETLRMHNCARSYNAETHSAFMEEFGHVSDGWDVTSTSLRENPAALLALLSLAKREPLVTTSAPELEIDDPHLRAMFMNARDLCAADEQQHFYAGLYLEKSRQMIAAIAQVLINHNAIDSADDIFFMTALELERFLQMPPFSLRAFVHRKKAITARLREKPVVPDDRHTESLNGNAMSGGIAQGPLFFADKFADFALLPHKAVLCLKTPNPSFAPWFDSCSAIITESGGSLSHGFIAARELQIPAVSGICLSQLPLNAHAIVDGNNGNITLLRRHTHAIGCT